MQGSYKNSYMDSILNYDPICWIEKCFPGVSRNICLHLEELSLPDSTVEERSSAL